MCFRMSSGVYVPNAAGFILYLVTIYYFTPNPVGECVYIAVGRFARGEATFTNLTHPQTPALAGASVGTRKVLRFWITAGVNLYLITFYSP